MSETWSSQETFRRQMARALEMRANGQTNATIAAALRIPARLVNERFYRHDRKATAQPVPVVVVREIKPETAPEVEDETVVWTAARKLAVARRVKAKWCISHIADDLNGMPGPRLSPRDVLVFTGRISA